MTTQTSWAVRWIRIASFTVAALGYVRGSPARAGEWRAPCVSSNLNRATVMIAQPRVVQRDAAINTADAAADTAGDIASGDTARPALGLGPAPGASRQPLLGRP